MGFGPKSGPNRLLDSVARAGYFLRFLRPVRCLLAEIVVSSLAVDLLVLPVTIAPQQFMRHFNDQSHLRVSLVLLTVATIVSGLPSLVEGWYCSYRTEDYLARAMQLEVFAWRRANHAEPQEFVTATRRPPSLKSLLPD